jgi:NADH-quinone oxidoreductase subunit C
MDDSLKKLGEHIETSCSDIIVSCIIAYGELNVVVQASAIVTMLSFLRNDSECLFSSLIDITAVDYPTRAHRFDIVYHLLSMYKNHRIRVKIETNEETQVPSVSILFPAANWFERETFDMYGVFFSGHPDLRRILTDYGFSGYPLRKDFPMTGYTEVRYDLDQKRVIYEPVKLVQEFRSFDFLSPWEGADYGLQDEKKSEKK